MARIVAITGAEAERALGFEATIEKVEEGYAALYRGAVDVPPIQNMENAEVRGEIDVKSALVCKPRAYASVKVASGFYRNSEQGLPTSFATILLLDGGTGVPLALMDGDLITNWRTGAAAAVASKHLSRPDSETVGVIGSGTIAAMALRAVGRVRPVSKARVWSPSVERRNAFALSLSAELGLFVEPVDSPENAVGPADLVITATPSRQPLVTLDMVRPGTHINAMGADGPGKQELDARVTAGAKLVVDRLAECRVAGELQHPLRLGLMREEDVHAEIGALVSGARPGRTSPDEITVFDATGVAVQDLAVATLVYERVKRDGLGVWIEL